MEVLLIRAAIPEAAIPSLLIEPSCLCNNFDELKRIDRIIQSYISPFKKCIEVITSCFLSLFFTILSSLASLIDG